MNNKVTQYFDLNAEIRELPAAGRPKDGGAPTIRAWPQWLTLLAGIIVQPYLATYRATGAWNFELADFWVWLVFSIIVAFVLFPSVYKKAFDATKPIGVLLAPIFTAGIGWEAIFSTAIEAIPLVQE